MLPMAQVWLTLTSCTGLSFPYFPLISDRTCSSFRPRSVYEWKIGCYHQASRRLHLKLEFSWKFCPGYLVSNVLAESVGKKNNQTEVSFSEVTFNAAPEQLCWQETQRLLMGWFSICSFPTNASTDAPTLNTRFPVTCSKQRQCAALQIPDCCLSGTLSSTHSRGKVTPREEGDSRLL